MARILTAVMTTRFRNGSLAFGALFISYAAYVAFTAIPTAV
jgi:hypothetical protein